MEKCFDDMQNIKKLKFEGDCDELIPKLCLLKMSGNVSFCFLHFQ